MTLDKAILHKKEHRKPYKGSKVFDVTCRNHGACSYCRDNRMYQQNKVEAAAKEQLREARYKDWTDLVADPEWSQYLSDNNIPLEAVQAIWEEAKGEN